MIHDFQRAGHRGNVCQCHRCKTVIYTFSGLQCNKSVMNLPPGISVNRLKQGDLKSRNLR